MATIKQGFIMANHINQINRFETGKGDKIKVESGHDTVIVTDRNTVVTTKQTFRRANKKLAEDAKKWRDAEKQRLKGNMGDISRHFSRHEFACRCGCGYDTVDVELITVLEDLRDYFGEPITITGPNRCPEHNAQTPGAASNSPHMRGIAADIKVRNVSPLFVAVYLESKYPDKYGIGRYNGRTHIDVRAEKARWDRR